jgi:hypothetical protein
MGDVMAGRNKTIPKPFAKPKRAADHLQGMNKLFDASLFEKGSVEALPRLCGGFCMVIVSCVTSFFGVNFVADDHLF